MKVVFQEIISLWKYFVLLLIVEITVTFATMMLPLLLQYLIDDAILPQDIGATFAITGIMLIFVALELASGIFAAKLAAVISMGTSKNLRSRVFKKVLSFSQLEVDKFSVSSLITRTNSDIQNIQVFLALTLSIALMAPIMCIVGVVMSIATSPGLSKILLITIPILLVALAIIGVIATPLSVKIQKKLDNVNMVIREKLSGTRVIRAFGSSDFEEKRFDKINKEYTKLNKRMMRIVAFLMPFVTIVVSVTVPTVIYLAVDSKIYGPANYTSGEVLALVSYIMYILAAVVMMCVVFLLLPKAATSARRVREVLESTSLIVDPKNPKNNTELVGYLEFKNVSFTYRGASKPAVNNLSFSAKPGEVTAIIGGTGMGKSTIINMIPRLYDCDEGQILVDGVDVRDYKIDTLRKKIGFVPQKAALFKGTIASNIAFGGDNPSEAAVEEAVKIAQSYDFVTGKEKSFEEPVSQGGSNFSGGQKQRLCIARAIVREPEIYIFDDSFSALDFKTDKALRSALKTKTHNATTLIVAQRVSTIMDADRIIVIHRGDIVGIGKHDELLQDCQVYKEIVESQIKESEVE